MSGDILNYRPARPTTILPGHWLIDLPPDTPIQIQRYRAQAPPVDIREQSLLDHPIDACWREINSRGNGAVKDILAGGCATIVGYREQERELWVFSSTGNCLGDSTSLEHVLPGPDAIIPSELLQCPRHGSKISCLSRPSTSQRPLKSCDVRFELQGTARDTWEKLGMAILEKAEWKRGKRVMPKGNDVQLLPDLNGLLLRVRCKKTRPPTTPSLPKIQIIQPLGIPALPVGPYRPTAREALNLAPSFEQVLGPSWKDGQSAYRLEALLGGRSYWDYTTLWIPESASTLHSRTSFDKVAEWKKGQGLLTIWPTHLLDDTADSTIRKTGSSGATQDTPVLGTSVDVLGIASGLFDAVSTYREPVDLLTPPGDISIDVETPAAEPIADPSPIPEWPDSTVNGHDDLEDLFASPASSNPSHAKLHFEMFGEDDRKHSFTNNADMIDYDDVIMSSPPPEYGVGERRVSVREIMGDEGHVDEVGPGLVTDDDFNFFDSPPDPEALVEPKQAPAVLMPTPDSLSAPSNEPTFDAPTDHPTAPSEPSPIIQTPIVEKVASPPPAPLILPRALKPAIVIKRPRTYAQDLIPYDFSPLELVHSRNSHPYNLTNPSYSPPNLNLDLIARLKPTTKKGKIRDYTLAWHLDASDSESEIDEYTRPPTPSSENEALPTPDRPPTPPLDEDTEDGQSRYLYQGHWCMAAGLYAMLDHPTRPSNVFVPWGANWGEEPASTVLDSPIATLSRKRKLSKDSSPPSNDLSLLARRIIQNRHARRPSCKTQSATVKYTTRLAEEGIILADLTGPADLVGNGLENTEHALLPCSIHTGFQGKVIQLSIASLRYWPELGLQPLSGPKDVKVGIITRNLSDEAQARRLTESIRDVYSALNLGAMEIEKSFGRDGIEAFHDEALWTEWLRSRTDSTVLFMFDETSSHGSYLPSLREMPDWSPNVACHVLPLSLEARDLPDAANEVYNSISRQARLVVPDDISPWYNYPTFTMAPSDRPKPQLSMENSLPKSYDVLGAWRWIHAGYLYDKSTGTMTVFVCDQEGDDWSVKSMAEFRMAWQSRVQFIWEAVTGFANEAATEWRASICSLGLMVPDELKAWRSIYTSCSEPISILMCDASQPHGQYTKARPGPPNVPLGMLNDPTASIMDESLACTYSTYSQRQPIPSDQGMVYSASSLLLSLASSNLEYDTSTYHFMYHRPAPGKEGDQDREMANEMYRLACWGKMRFGLEGLPAHLAALVVIDDTFAAEEVGLQRDIE